MKNYVQVGIDALDRERAEALDAGDGTGNIDIAYKALKVAILKLKHAYAEPTLESLVWLARRFEGHKAWSWGLRGLVTETAAEADEVAREVLGEEFKGWVR